jgi:hypothetical protein
MSENTDLATLGDLIGQSSEELEIQLKSINKKVKIKRASVGDLADILKVSKDQDLEMALWLIFKCMTVPKLDMVKVRQLQPIVALEIAREISKFSGVDQATTSKMADFLETNSALQSS